MNQSKLNDIINTFIATYVGTGKLIPSVKRTDLMFHAKRGLQEFSYDTLNSVKSQELNIPPSLSVVIPQDYVNYVKLVRVGDDGIERILYPTGKTSNPFAISQDSNGVYQYTDTGSDGIGDTLTEQSPSDTINNYQTNEFHIPLIC